MAFSLGLNIAQSDLSVKSFIVSNVVFSLASPIGVGIGIAMTDLPSSLPHDVCNGVLQGNLTINNPSFIFQNRFSIFC